MSERKPISKELEALIVDDSDEAIDIVLRRALEPYMRFSREGRMIRKEPFLMLSDPAKLLVHLLGRRAMTRLSLPNAAAEVTADVLHTECGVPLKSCREYLSRFKGRRLLEKDSHGYFVPTWAVADVAAAVSRPTEN